MEISVSIWDKVSSINGVTPERLREKFIQENGSDDRVLFAYDGVVGRIQYLDDSEFDGDEKEYMNALISGGADAKQAIVDTWLYKVQKENSVEPEVDEIDDLREAVNILLEEES